MEVSLIRQLQAPLARFGGTVSLSSGPAACQEAWLIRAVLAGIIIGQSRSDRSSRCSSAMPVLRTRNIMPERVFLTR